MTSPGWKVLVAAHPISSVTREPSRMAVGITIAAHVPQD